MTIILSAESGLEQWQDVMDLEDIYIRIRARHESGLFTREAVMQELLYALRGVDCPKDQADQWFERLWRENVLTNGPPGPGSSPTSSSDGWIGSRIAGRSATLCSD